MAPLTFTTAAELYHRKLKRSRLHGVADVRLAANTFLGPRGDFAYAVRFHATDIVTLHADDTYTLTTGGWFTPTTKARMQEYAPVRLASVGGLWYMRGALASNPKQEPWTYPAIFFDGVRLNAEGTVRNPIDAESTEKAKRQLDREVSKYIKGFAADIRANGLRSPSGGDCWGCAMHAENGTTAEAMGLDHYRGHFEEGYYVPSLLYNALLEKGYANPGYAWQDIESDAKRGGNSWLLSNALRSFFGRRKPALLGLTDIVPVKTGPVTIGQAIGASQARQHSEQVARQRGSR